MSDAPTVTRNDAARRFEAVVDGHLAELVYSQSGDRMTLVHTGVPDELEGRGIGGRLVEAAIANAREQGLTIVPQCPFARGWIDRHPDAVAGVAVEAG